MIHILPKEIIMYILSLCVVERYIDRYRSNEVNVQVIISLLTIHDRFRKSRIKSSMANFMNTLSLVHPTFRKILKNACTFEKEYE